MFIDDKFFLMAFRVILVFHTAFTGSKLYWSNVLEGLRRPLSNLPNKQFIIECRPKGAP